MVGWLSHDSTALSIESKPGLDCELVVNVLESRLLLLFGVFSIWTGTVILALFIVQSKFKYLHRNYY